MDMNESCIPPYLLTMNVVLCFFCKVGIGDVAMELYNSRFVFRLSLNHLVRKYLILTLCWDGSVNEAYNLLRSSVVRGYFPDEQTFYTLASALCWESKINEIKELMYIAIGRNFVPRASIEIEMGLREREKEENVDKIGDKESVISRQLQLKSWLSSSKSLDKEAVLRRLRQRKRAKTALEGLMRAAEATGEDQKWLQLEYDVRIKFE
ncbi:hypothetical protein Fmac_014854 [Flemingia macrophylla]|uniref:Pentatricopeptide repeat-containing protein n=1 Tax=Flemingia macrophylla TaxID=520843 RepID=A0ABD1MCV8_9FABA